MVVLGVLLSPITDAVSMLCSIDPAYTHKKNVDERLCSLPLVHRRQNIVIFPKHVPGHAKPACDWRCRRCSCRESTISRENRVCLFCGESSYYEPDSHSLHGTLGGFRHFNHNTSKRISHFKNWVARLQGKERCAITREEISNIADRIVMYPDSMSEVQQIRLAMKELGLQKYYNHAYYVMRNIFGYSLVEFRKINEARLLALFMRIQEPFSRIQKGRTNMLSYQFLIRKFCELLGYELAVYIPLLKSRANLQRQDVIWKQICHELGLPFYASV